mmetsp:Transcript_24387/g.47902  ORF Transcript_24387/g.47902 Transcript_24387/m.47902 type:complete len:90 (-) Transcript_24387:935-1204(-)
MREESQERNRDSQNMKMDHGRLLGKAPLPTCAAACKEEKKSWKLRVPFSRHGRPFIAWLLVSIYPFLQHATSSSLTFPEQQRQAAHAGG